MQTEFIKNWLGKTISVVIDYKNPSGFDDNIKGILTEVGDDFIVIVPLEPFCKANLIRWQYIKSIRLYENEAKKIN
jgi:hypothetical protein